jgi:succinyl-diaminopimelate desuccinylase
VLIDAVTKTIASTQQIQTQCSTAGGTSDGRFIAPMGCEVVELGPVNETIHKVDECVAIEDLEVLASLYRDILQRLLVPSAAASENA